MGRIWTAIKAFFLALWDGDLAERIEVVLSGEVEKAPPPTKEVAPAAPPMPARKTPARSDAITLLAAMQREARFIDFVQEKLDAFSDAEIGAVARDIHRDCGKVLGRMFAIHPAVPQEEGAAIKIPAGFDAGRYRLVGNLSGQPPYQGEVAHHGWEAGQCELPEWNGGDGSAKVIAPAEVEVA